MDINEERFNKIESDFTGLRNELSGVKADVAGLVPLVQQSLEELRSIKTRQNQPTNWVALGALVISGLMYMQSTQAPLKDGIEGLVETAKALTSTITQNSINHADLKGATEENEKWVRDVVGQVQEMIRENRRRTSAVEAEVGRVGGLLEELSKQVDLIDSGGSRAWNGKIEKPNVK